MASSSYSTSMLHRGSFTPKQIKYCNKELTFNHSSFCCKSSIHCKSLSATTDIKPSRLLLPNEKSIKWKQIPKFSLTNSVQCRALEIENTPIGKKFQLDDVIEAQQFDRDTLSAIFDVAREMEKIEKNSPGSQILKGYLMATLFYEPSTRTRLSFESAMKRLGGEVLTTENAREFSSAAKGETLEGICIFLIFYY